MSVTFGSIGDIIAICLLIKDVAECLNNSKGSKAQYKEVIGELSSLERALLQVEQLSRSYTSSKELDALFDSTRQTAKNCHDCVHKFFEKIKKFDDTLGENASGNIVARTTAKVKWELKQKEEVTKFRTEIGTHSAALNILLATAGIAISKANADKVAQQLNFAKQISKVATREQQGLLRDIQEKVRQVSWQLSEYRISSTYIASTVVNLLPIRRFYNIGLELKALIGDLLSTTNATHQAVLEIQKGGVSSLERCLIQEPFILEDAIGRLFPVPLQFISSWEMLETVIEMQFRDFQGYKKIKNKEYIFQEQATLKEITRTRRWETAFLPGQKVSMSVIFKKQDEDGAGSRCPSCQTVSAQTQTIEIKCSGCGINYQRIIELEEDTKLPEAPMPIPSFGKVKTYFGPNAPDSPITPMARHKRKLGETDFKVENEMSRFKRVRVILKPKRRNPFSRQPSQNNPAQKRKLENTDAMDIDEPESSPKRFRADEETPSDHETEAKSSSEPSQKASKTSPPVRKPTEADARKHHIPVGYSLKNWDPTEEPILLLGSVFDANSLGKWIYDWAVYHSGPATSIADMAGELWLLLIQVSGKIKRIEECMPRVKIEENRELLLDYIESGERQMDKLQKLLKLCEAPMLKAGKKRQRENKNNQMLSNNAGLEFVDNFFGRDHQLESTEKFLESALLWNTRFDTHCEDIVRNYTLKKRRDLC